MVTGLNTNVQYRGKVFHVQTEDCERRSLIRTVIFNSGRVVAATDSSYAELTRSDSLDEQLCRRLGDQHWTLVTRLREGELSLDMEPEGHAPVAEAAQADGAHREVKSGLTALDRRLARLRALADKIAEEKTARSESRRRVAERSRQRRVFTPLLALGAIVLVALGWTVRSWRDGASPQEGAVLAVLDSPARNGRTAAAAESVAAAQPAALEVAVAELPVESVDAKPVPPSATAADARPTEPARSAPPKPPATTKPRIERKPPPDKHPTEPTPVLVEQPAVPDPTPAPEVLPEPEDWTGRLVALADVDVPPRSTQRDLPRYTKRARRKKQQGSVELNLLVNEHGNVAQIRLLKTIPNSDLNEAALEIARFWQFVPARKESYPVRVWKPVTLDFSIASGVARVLVLEK